MEQTPPNEKELERNILSTCIVDPDSCIQVLEILSEHDFFTIDHKNIYKHIKQIGFKNKGKISEALLISELNDKENTDLSGYIEDLIMSSPIVPDPVKISEKLKRVSIRRQIYFKAQKALSDALNPRYEGDLLEETQKSFSEVIWNSGGEQIIHCSGVAAEVVSQVQKKRDNPDYMRGIKIGYGGIEILPGEYITLAARTSQGKTAFAGQVCQNVLTQGKRSLFISLEMTNERVMERFFAGQAKFDSLKFKDASFTNTEFNEMQPLKEYFDELPLYFLSAESLSPDQFKKVVRLAVKKYKIEVIILDYLTKLDLKTTGTKNKENAVSEASQAIQQSARGLNVPIISLAQLNRSAKDRQNKEPVLTDLRDSGSLEMDSCQVWFLHKPGAHPPDGQEPELNMTDLIIAKNRNGALGRCKLWHDMRTSTYSEVDFYH